MTEVFDQHAEEDDPLEEMKDLTAQWANYFNGIQQVLDNYERLQQRVAALESENAALTDTVEQWKNNDEWSNRVTYDNVVDQIASLEDASKRDDARRLIEALLKKSQVTQFRRDISLNPVSITHKQKDGERWIKRDENNQQKAFYYVLSAKAAVEASKADPVQAGLDFETGSNEEWHDGDPF